MPSPPERAATSRLSRLAPLLVGPAFVLALGAANAAEVEILPLAVATAVALVLAAAVLAVSRLFFDEPTKASILAAAVLLCFFLYGHLFERMIKWGVISRHDVLHGVLTSICVAGIAGLAWALVRLRRDTQGVAQAIGVAFLLVCVSSTVRLLAAPRSAEERAIQAEHAARMAAIPHGEPLEADDPAHPDIYQILLDGYARPDVQAKVFGHDDSAFIEGLRQRGFYVATESAANYPLTFMSLGSMLNVQYLDEVAAQVGPKSKSHAPVNAMLADHFVGRTLQARGYRYVHFNTKFSGTQTSDIADVSISYKPAWLQSELASVLLRTTALKFIETNVADMHLFMFERLAQVPEMKGPTFTLAHFLLPHNPYVFDAEGRVQKDISMSLMFQQRTGGWKNKRAYIEQLTYTGKRALQVVDEILARSPNPPVIVLHSDHGSASTRKKDRAGLVAERVPILMAIYAPPAVRERLYPTITPVNVYRVLLETLFGEPLPLLPDRSFFAWYKRPYDLVDVTAALKPQAQAGPGGSPPADH